MMFWYRKAGLLAYCLVPFSFLYRLVVALRMTLYRLGMKRVTSFSVPVVVVGNITVGGSGKSPLVASLVEYFQKRGHRPGVVSRGYGGKAQQWPQIVTAGSDPREVGDEPVMLVRQTQCPMVVAPNRVLAAQVLIQTFDCTVVISDDGLQHHALGRDVEIAVLDGDRRLGNGLCLPAGPLRESQKRLETVDAIVVNGDALPNEIAMSLEAGDVYLIQDRLKTEPLNLLAGQTVHAVAGIGNPQRFFQQLRGLGMTVIEHSFSDHHAFEAKDIDFDDALRVIMTEKDAVKCQGFVDERHWCLPVRAVLPDSFFDDIECKIA